MVHTMSLIHDDLPAMDDDDYRRGKPTCHKVYGEDVAILAGDALLSTAFAVLAKRTPRGEIGGEEGGREGRLLDAVVRLGEAVSATGLAGGQVMDLQCEGRPSAEVSVDDLKWIHTHKTAKLLNICVAASAVLSGASPPQVRSLELFADKVGLAFQVADDILDVTASSDALGKTAGKDEATDKATYVRKLGLDGAREEAERLVKEAKGHLDELGFGGRVDGLKAIADFIIDRKY
jgi:geranylgeranyl diphosphate synthase type II